MCTLLPNTVASKSTSLNDIWPDLEEGLEAVYSNARKTLTNSRYMELYQYVQLRRADLAGPDTYHRHVYAFCTSPSTRSVAPIDKSTTMPKQGTLSHEAWLGPDTLTGAHLVGKDLYDKLHEFLKKRCAKLCDVSPYCLLLVEPL